MSMSEKPALPQISFNGYVFNPKRPASDASYSINLKEGGWELQSCKGKNYKIELVESNERFSTTPALRFLARCKTIERLFALGGLISTGSAGYFFGVKKDYRFSIVSVVITGVLVVAYSYFNGQRRRASFDIANGALKAHKNLTCTPSDYGLA